MKLIFKVLLAALLIAQGAIAVFGMPAQAMAAPRTMAMYSVSGILLSNGNGAVIKLVQGVHVAGSTNEAIGTFTRVTQEQYPGYSLMDTVATALRTPPAENPRCIKSI